MPKNVYEIPMNVYNILAPIKHGLLVYCFVSKQKTTTFYAIVLHIQYLFPAMSPWTAENVVTKALNVMQDQGIVRRICGRRKSTCKFMLTNLAGVGE